MIITDAARPVPDEYMYRVENTYGATLERVSFPQVDRTLAQINEEISKLTNSQINDAIVREDLYKVGLETI